MVVLHLQLQMNLSLPFLDLLWLTVTALQMWGQLSGGAAHWGAVAFLQQCCGGQAGQDFALEWSTGQAIP